MTYTEKRRRRKIVWNPSRPSGVVSHVLRSEEHTSELQSQSNLVCRLLLEKKKNMKQEELREQRITVWKGVGLAALAASFGVIAWRAHGPALSQSALMHSERRVANCLLVT